MSERDSLMTDPQQAGLFVKETKVDMLAVTIGNVHGKYSALPELDFARLEAIQLQVPADMPLVLHGASGLSPDWIHGSMKRGVCKFNVNTDLREAMLDHQRLFFTREDQSEADILQAMAGATDAMSTVAAEKIRLFSGGR